SNTGTINVVFDNVGSRDLIIRDMAGRLIREIKGATSNSIEITNLRNGVYSIQVRNKATGQSQFQKVIVRRK
ncbi:MAG: T9SS type A sorting domain-containing protein, partial [Chitinophagaceae bacterium]